MRILFVQDHCSLGGHTFLRLEVAQCLIARGHAVSAFFFEDVGCFETFSAHCPAIVGSSDDLRNLLREDVYDVVHGDASMQDLPAILKSAAFGGRLVITRHHVDSTVGWHAANCDIYSAESASSAALMAPYSDLPIDLLPNGIDVSVFQPVDCPVSDRPIVAWCGRSGSSFKNVAQFLRVTRLLGNSQYRFLIADGSDEGTTRMKEWGDTSHIESWRSYRRGDFPVFFSEVARSGGCLLVTSLMEGLPMTLLEALACGCPVVARNSRGIEDVLSGSLAEWMFSPTANDQEVADFVVDCLRRASTSQPHAFFRQSIIDRFSVDVMADGYLAAYQRPLPPDRVLRDRKERDRIAQNLWTHSAGTLKEGGRPRDALFALRAALHFAPRSVLAADRLIFLFQCLHSARGPAAVQQVSLSRHEFKHGRLASGLKHLGQALRLHPAALLIRDSTARD